MKAEGATDDMAFDDDDDEMAFDSWIVIDGAAKKQQEFDRSK